MKIHNSMRGHFAHYIHKQMKKNTNIYVLTADLGYGMWDNVRKDYKDRFINCGASEQAMLDVAVGMAYSSKIPVCYSITPFLIYRAYETIRTYINHEKLNVKLIGGGRDKQYETDGFSHDATDVKQSLSMFSNIKQYWPEKVEDIEELVINMIRSSKPSFVSLSR